METDNRDQTGPEFLAASICPLTPRQQTINILLYGANVGLIYLGCAVFYVGMTEAALCQGFHASDEISNLPASAYSIGAFLPVFVAWYLPFVRVLKPVLAASYLSMALAGVLMTAVLLVCGPTSVSAAAAGAAGEMTPSAWLAISAVTVYAVIVGAANQLVATFQWEVVGRGIPESRRGQAFALAFGAGPVLAVVGSLGSQLILAGKLELPYLDSSLSFHLHQFAIKPLSFPLNYAVLFAASVPIMALAALLSLLFIVPQPAVEVERQPFVAGVFGGLGEFLNYRTIRYAAVATILIFAGNLVMGNVSLYTKQVLGTDATSYVGYQNALRFGFKIFAGLALGWLLAKTSPRAGLIATALICFAGVLWAVLVPGKWFMISFGLLGAGELYGNYYPNYILSCSPTSKMRRNMALSGMLPMISAPAAVFFGWISHHYGFNWSFYVAMGIIAATIFVVIATLPAHPRPRRQDMDASDLALEGPAPVMAANPQEVSA